LEYVLSIKFQNYFKPLARDTPSEGKNRSSSPNKRQRQASPPDNDSTAGTPASDDKSPPLNPQAREWVPSSTASISDNLRAMATFLIESLSATNTELVTQVLKLIELQSEKFNAKITLLEKQNIDLQQDLTRTKQKLQDQLTRLAQPLTTGPPVPNNCQVQP
jgi:hypothetical protein